MAALRTVALLLTAPLLRWQRDAPAEVSVRLGGAGGAVRHLLLRDQPEGGDVPVPARPPAAQPDHHPDGRLLHHGHAGLRVGVPPRHLPPALR